MADMAEISRLSKLILAHLQHLSPRIDQNRPIQCFEKANSIMTAISQLDMADPKQIEQFVARLSQIVSKAISKNHHQEGILHHENGHKNLAHDHSPELAKTQSSRWEWEEVISNACWVFLQKIDNLLRKSLRCGDRQAEKQNRNQNSAFDDQIVSLFVREMNQLLKQVEKVKLDEAYNKKEQSFSKKMQCESEGCHKHDYFHSKSSCRSLLTEKLKNIATVDNDEENTIFCVEDKIVIKGNWVLREMKGHQNEKGSQPAQMLSFHEDSFEANVRSLGIPMVTRKQHKTELPLRKGILEQMRPFTQNKKEKKVLKNEGGCARCEIY